MPQHWQLIGSLEFWNTCVILYEAMTPRLVRQFFILFFAAFLAAGMSLSAVQAANMTAKMAMASDTGASGYGDCGGCGGGTDDGKTVVCPPACLAPVAAVLSHAESMTAFMVVMNCPPPKDILLLGSAPSPDPYPPRPSDLA
ncbi:MAG: hypothetical protein ACYC1L_19445 [Alphaproteobacteria bacterium]